MKIGAGLIDNGQRQVLADWVRHRIEPQVDTFISSSHIPSSKKVDISNRVIYLIREARRQKVDFLYLVENDDYYPSDYIADMESKRGDADFINTYKYIRYNVAGRQVQYIGHKKGKYYIGGLWTMGFRPECVNKYFWQFVPKNERFVDGYLCRWFQDRFKCVWHNDHKGVGIKGHSYGKSNPNGAHKQLPLPYMVDEYLHIFEGLTDEGFMKLHFPEHEYIQRKTNAETRKYLQTFFPGTDTILDGEA